MMRVRSACKPGVGVLLVLLCLSPAGAVQGQRSVERYATSTTRNADEAFGVKAVTRPSRDATMGFPFPTAVAEVLASDGQAVEAGAMLVRADDAEAAAAYAISKIRAESPLDVDLQQAALELAGIEFESNKRAFEGGGGSTIELDRARLNKQTAEIQLQGARQREQEAARQLDQLAARVDDHHLKAPFDGIVDAVLVDIGDSVRDTDPVVRVVSIDPLLVDVATPTDVTLGLSTGDPAWVLVRIGEDPRILSGTILGVSPVADSVTGARRVRVEARNPNRLPAGLTAFVRFEEPTGEWADVPVAGDEPRADPQADAATSGMDAGADETSNR